MGLNVSRLPEQSQAASHANSHATNKTHGHGHAQHHGRPELTGVANALSRSGGHRCQNAVDVLTAKVPAPAPAPAADVTGPALNIQA